MNEIPVVSEASVGEPEFYRHKALQEYLEFVELLAKDHEGDSGNPREPLLRFEDEGDIRKEDNRDEVLVQPARLTLNAKHIVSCCRMVSGEINARHDTIVNALFDNNIIRRGLTAHEQKSEEMKTAMA